MMEKKTFSDLLRIEQSDDDAMDHVEFFVRRFGRWDKVKYSELAGLPVSTICNGPYVMRWKRDTGTVYYYGNDMVKSMVTGKGDLVPIQALIERMLSPNISAGYCWDEFKDRRFSVVMGLYWARKILRGKILPRREAESMLRGTSCLKSTRSYTRNSSSQSRSVMKTGNR